VQFQAPKKAINASASKAKGSIHDGPTPPKNNPWQL